MSLKQDILRKTIIIYVQGTLINYVTTTTTTTNNNNNITTTVMILPGLVKDFAKHQ